MKLTKVLTIALILISVGLSAQWEQLPIRDVFGDKTGKTTPFIEVPGSYSDLDSSEIDVKVIVFYVDGMLKFRLTDITSPDTSIHVAIAGNEEKESQIYFKGIDGIASEALPCSYSNEEDLFSIIVKSRATKKMLEGGRFLMKNSNGSVCKFAIPKYSGLIQYNDEEIGTRAGTGPYDESGDGIFGRKVVYRDHSYLDGILNSESGKIYMKVCIDREGKITYVEIDTFNTTIKNKRVLKKALEMIKDYRYEADYNAPKEQCGMIKLFININRRYR